MATLEQKYDSLCDKVQELNDYLDDDSIILTEEQIQDLIKRIGKAQQKIENFSKNNKHL
jgi:hypothetical protein